VLASQALSSKPSTTRKKEREGRGGKEGKKERKRNLVI
jgi:hypothetical protein